jgi:hypothetical protein
MTDLEKYGLVIKRAHAVPGGMIWRAEAVRHVPAGANDGRFHIYVDAYMKQDPVATLEAFDGAMLEQFAEVQVSGKVVVAWWSGEDTLQPLPADHLMLQTWAEKPYTEPGVNFPMNKAATYRVGLMGCTADMVFGLHTRHDDEGPGATWGHHSFYIKYVASVAAVPPTVEPTPPPIDPPAETLEEFVRRRSWDAVGVDYNPDAAFVKYATAHGLGKPETQEYDVVHKGKPYRAQAFTKGIVACEVGLWEVMWFIPW